MKNLYGLLVGIDKYFNYPLRQCLADVGKIKAYCLSLKTHFKNIKINTLLDEEATKTNIKNKILNLLAEAKETDSFLFYYSGHGAQEIAGGRFVDEQDDLLECLVCYHQKDEQSSYLLANKELRYLLTKGKTNPHIVTVFDCCHSGDMLQSEEKTIKGLAKVFPKRPYKEFLFHKELSAQTLQKENFAKKIPFKNNIHLSACQSNQAAWEGEHGGIFTQYLLQLLNQTKSHLNYQFLVQWAKINIRDHSPERQIPTLSVQGLGKLNAYSSWLGIYKDNKIASNGQLIYQAQKGWQLTLGKISGIQKGATLRVEAENKKEVTAKVNEVNWGYTTVQLPKEVHLNPQKIYTTKLKNSFLPLKIHVFNAIEATFYKQLIENMLAEEEGVVLGSKNDSDFFISIFNQQVYFSLPDTPYQPLNHQLSLALGESAVKDSIAGNLKLLKKWNHFNTLYNPNQLSAKPLIKVELIPDGGKMGIDITDAEYALNPFPDRMQGEWSAKYRIKVSNLSKKELYILVLILGSDLSISAGAFNKQSVLLSPGEFKFLYNHLPEATARCFLDTYKEVYNWKQEWFHYKFIVCEEGDISGSTTFLQKRVYPPLLRSNPMHFVGVKGYTKQKKYWTIHTSTIYLKNPTYNKISGELEKYLDWYLTDKRVAPFLKKLYPKSAFQKEQVV